MDGELSDAGWANDLTDAQIQETLLEEKIIGNYWATQRINIAWNEGSDRFRRNQTYITWWFRHYMKKLGLINDEQHWWLMKIIGCTEVFYGIVLSAAGLVAFYQTYEKWERFKAAAATTARVAQGPPGWAMIAFALAMAGACVGGVYAGTRLHELIGPPNLNIDVSFNIDWSSAQGRAFVTQAVHEQITGGLR